MIERFIGKKIISDKTLTDDEKKTKHERAIAFYPEHAVMKTGDNLKSYNNFVKGETPTQQKTAAEKQERKTKLLDMMRQAEFSVAAAAAALNLSPSTVRKYIREIKAKNQG